MISKILPLMVMGMGAQSYFSKTKKGKELAKKAAKKKMKKMKREIKDVKNTSDDKSATTHGKYK